MKSMERRDFIKLLGLAGMSTAMPSWVHDSHAAQSVYDGPFYISIDVRGGWDVTSFCDPKMNIAGEEEINHWARTGEIQTAGNIRYAPFADNARFFQRFYSHMLVINGVDAQTNSHDAGVVHSWSGRISPGYPSFAAMTAAIYGANLPISYINNGGYRETAGIVRYSQIQDTLNLKELLNPNIHYNWSSETRYHQQASLDIIKSFKQQRMQALINDQSLTPRQRKGVTTLYMADSGQEQLKQFADLLPDELVSDQGQISDNYRVMRRQAELALRSFQAGLTVSCDLNCQQDFDTHDTHDVNHAESLKILVDGVEFLFDLAGDLGISDRLFVVMGSDFGRTPWYNDDNGKDHWPIGSFVILQENASWGNRMVGLTDDGHNALKMNPTTLQVDESDGGTIIYPKHVHDALRRLAGINGNPISQQFDLRVAEQFDFFNPAVSS